MCYDLPALGSRGLPRSVFDQMRTFTFLLALLTPPLLAQRGAPGFMYIAVVDDENAA